MKTTVQNEVFGEISLDENFWTGKKSLSINGAPLQKIGKNIFEYEKEGQKYTASTRGSFLTGTTLNIGDQIIKVTEKPAWYEIASSIFIFAFILVWGNVSALCQILPLVGGAIGGAISAVFGILNLLIMKSTKNIFLKLLSFVLCFGATILVCWGIALGILAAVA